MRLTLWLPFAVRQVNVSVLKVLRGGSSSLESPVMKIEAKALIRRPSGRGGWVSLNIEELVARWFENPKDNHGIVVHATDEFDRQIVVTDHEEDNGALVSVATLQACLCRDRGRCRSTYSMAAMVRGACSSRDGNGKREAWDVICTCRLEDNIKVGLKEVGREVVDWINRTQEEAIGGLFVE